MLTKRVLVSSPCCLMLREYKQPSGDDVGRSPALWQTEVTTVHTPLSNVGIMQEVGLLGDTLPQAES